MDVSAAATAAAAASSGELRHTAVKHEHPRLHRRPCLHRPPPTTLPSCLASNRVHHVAAQQQHQHLQVAALQLRVVLEDLLLQVAEALQEPQAWWVGGRASTGGDSQAGGVPVSACVAQLAEEGSGDACL